MQKRNGDHKSFGEKKKGATREMTKKLVADGKNWEE